MSHEVWNTRAYEKIGVANSRKFYTIFTVKEQKHILEVLSHVDMDSLESCSDPQCRQLTPGSMKHKIVVICHKNNRRSHPGNYIIHHLAQFWRDDGHDVQFLFGVENFVPADLAVLHVDLSVVPDEYLRFAARYPIALNGKVRDIRKSTISDNLLAYDDSYEGEVIVKSNRNFGGSPERALQPIFMKVFERCFRRHTIRSEKAYRIYRSVGEVPRVYFTDKNFIVERFLPEKEGDLYFVRLYMFLGDRSSCVRVAAREPIIKGSNCVKVEVIEPHPDIVNLRHKLAFDYGKFDYVVHEGKAVLLDANKTTGAGNLFATNPENLMRRRH